MTSRELKVTASEVSFRNLIQTAVYRVGWWGNKDRWESLQGALRNLAERESGVINPGRATGQGISVLCNLFTPHNRRLILDWMRCQMFKTLQETSKALNKQPSGIIMYNYVFVIFSINSEWTREADIPKIFVFSQPNFTWWWNRRIIHSQPHRRHCAYPLCKYCDFITGYWDPANLATWLTNVLVVSPILDSLIFSSYQYRCMEEKYSGVLLFLGQVT